MSHMAEITLQLSIVTLLKMFSPLQVKDCFFFIPLFLLLQVKCHVDSILFNSLFCEDRYAKKRKKNQDVHFSVEDAALIH